MLLVVDLPAEGPAGHLDAVRGARARGREEGIVGRIPAHAEGQGALVPGPVDLVQTFEGQVVGADLRLEIVQVVHVGRTELGEPGLGELVSQADARIAGVRDPAAEAQGHALVAALVEVVVAVLVAVEDVDAQQQGRSHEPGLGEVQVDVPLAGAELPGDSQVLPLPHEIRLRHLDEPRGRGLGAVGHAEGELAGLLLLHPQGQVDVPGYVRLAVIHLHVLEVPQLEDVALGKIQAGLVEDVPGHQAHLAQDHVVVGLQVVLDRHAADRGHLPLVEDEGDVHRLVPDIALRLDGHVDVARVPVEGMEGLQGLHVVALAEDVAGLQEHELGDRQVVERLVPGPVDRPHVVLGAFLQVEGQVHLLAILHELHVHAQELGVQVAVVAVEGQDALLVLLELLLLEGGALEEEAAGALFHGLVQLLLVEDGVAREGDRPGLDLGALVDGDHQVLHVAGVDHRGIDVRGHVVVALLVVELAQRRQFPLDHGRVGELAHAQFQGLVQVVVLDLVVVPVGDLPDPREFGDVQDQANAAVVLLLVDVDVGELPGREQGADGFRHGDLGIGLALVQIGPGLDLPRAHGAYARDVDRDDLLDLGPGRRRGPNAGQEGQSEQENEVASHHDSLLRNDRKYYRPGILSKHSGSSNRGMPGVSGGERRLRASLIQNETEGVPSGKDNVIAGGPIGKSGNPIGFPALMNQRPGRIGPEGVIPWAERPSGSPRARCCASAGP